jgi:hypothetical protein
VLVLVIVVVDVGAEVARAGVARESGRGVGMVAQFTM